MKTDISTVQQQIATTGQAIKDAKLTHEQAEARRRPLLLANNVAALDENDRELDEQRQREIRGVERLAELRKELVRLSQLQERARHETLRSEAVTCSEKIAGIDDELAALFAKAVPLLAARSLNYDHLTSANTLLKHAGLPPVASPEETRRELFVETPERVVEEETRPAGIYDAAGKALDPRAAATTRTRTVIPATRTGGRQPTPLHLAAILPPVRWGDPGWNGGELLGHHSAMESPATTRKAATTSPADATA